MMWFALSVCPVILGHICAAVEYCNSNMDICAQFEDGFNSKALGEISEWWDELEKNVKPLKCEFSVREDEEREQVRSDRKSLSFNADNGTRDMYYSSPFHYLLWSWLGHSIK